MFDVQIIKVATLLAPSAMMNIMVRPVPSNDWGSLQFLPLFFLLNFNYRLKDYLLYAFYVRLFGLTQECV